MSVQIRFGARRQLGDEQNATANLATASFADPRIRASMRRALADEVERLLDIIDALDGDPDFEAAGDDEPSLGWSVSMAHGATDDAEQGELAP